MVSGPEGASSAQGQSRTANAWVFVVGLPRGWRVIG
jgi:hypothetical protein